jgi:nucleoside-diphosphate-sugar epimerase
MIVSASRALDPSGVDKSTVGSLFGAEPPSSEAGLDEYLSRPTSATVAAMRERGDLLVLGAGGKIGLSLCATARRAFDASGRDTSRVIAISRFGHPETKQRFAEAGVETISADLLTDGVMGDLPDAGDVAFLAGMKFGSSGDLPGTWAMNTFLPGLVARRYKESRIVALSTGNVYGLSSQALGGSTEQDPEAPVGEYAQSCLGRERMFAYGSQAAGTRVAIIRLNYANALRYGVLVDIGRKVLAGDPIDVAMGSVNVIWQGDVNNQLLRAFDHCQSPPFVINLTGPDVASVRRVALRFADLLDAPAPQFVGTEAPSALLSNASRSHGLFGYPDVPLDQLIAWTAAWLRSGGSLLGKPTGFEVRDGRF